MAKTLNNVIGLDLGRHALKAVLLQRRGQNRYALTHFGSHVPDEPAQDAATLQKQLKSLFKDMGGSAKTCAVSISGADAFIRIIEQPETPTHLLRDALRLNGMTLLNQDVKSFVLDCDLIGAESGGEQPGVGGSRRKYLVGGVPRSQVEQISSALSNSSVAVHGLHLSPVCAFNAFELACPEIFAAGAFFLLDIGHTSSTLLVGMDRNLALVRSIDFGGKTLLEALCGLSGDGREEVIAALELEDEVMVEYTRVALTTLTREIGSSIGFIEQRHESAISRIYVSGGPAKSRIFLKLMGEELGMPCETWSAVEKCEVAVAPQRQADFHREALDLNIACGVALNAMNAN